MSNVQQQCKPPMRVLLACLLMSLVKAYLFGPFPLHSSQIFFETALSIGFVNLKPIVPGHVLIIPKRVEPRLTSLSPEEYHDLFSAVRLCAPVIERHCQAEALNIAIQDGAAAGQSVPHVHVHILPRKLNDFKRNDDVYDHLENQKLDEAFQQTDSQVDPTAERMPRSKEEMAAESAILRALFEVNNTEL